MQSILTRLFFDVNAIYVTREVKIPDPLRLGRYRKTPELGPCVLFFSGGTALTATSQVLKSYSHNSVHMVTPFDSGGSSAVLRRAFNMPSIGDLRSRLMALADETVTGHPDVYKLFTHRFSLKGDNRVLLKQLEEMCVGKHPLIRAVSNPIRYLIRMQLKYFLEAEPASFDLRGASIGNLILTGGYLNNNKHLDPIIFLFSKLVGVQGTVRAIVNDNLHLATHLEDGRLVVGQHRLTGKEVAPLTSPIKQLYLSADPEKLVPARATLRKKNRNLIGKAELLCYPPGSFYTSLIANLLPAGVGEAIAGNPCPKVYVPSLGRDPEQKGMTLDSSIRTLLRYLHDGTDSVYSTENFLNFVLLDSKQGKYPGGVPKAMLKELGIQLIDTRLVSKRSAPYYDPELLVASLLSLT